MGVNQSKIPPKVHLKFKKGELIIKQGDYGVSIYKIVEGTVRIFNEFGDKKFSLATLGRGEVFGEMTFLNKGTEPRSACARALEDTELEVWHPSALSKEYDRMPHVVKYIANQVIRRLMRMNQLVAQFSAKKEHMPDKGPQEDPEISKRVYFRKDVNQECVYRPLDAPPKVRLRGKVKDISLNGVGIEIRSTNTLKFSHEVGNQFIINMVLPTGKRLALKAKIVSVRRDRALGRLTLGMQFVEIEGENTKTLGFFMRS